MHLQRGWWFQVGEEAGGCEWWRGGGRRHGGWMGWEKGKQCTIQPVMQQNSSLFSFLTCIRCSCYHWSRLSLGIRPGFSTTFPFFITICVIVDSLLFLSLSKRCSIKTGPITCAHPAARSFPLHEIIHWGRHKRCLRLVAESSSVRFNTTGAEWQRDNILSINIITMI